DDTVALARLTAAAGDIEGEASRLVPADARLGQLGEELADEGEDADVGRRVAPRGAADRRLVDVDHLVHRVHALDGAVAPGTHLGPMEVLGQPSVQDVVDQGALAAAADSGDAGERAQWEGDVDLPEVVLRSA